MPECSTQERWGLQCGKETAQGPWRLSFQLSPKPQTPISPHRTLFYSTLPPLEPRKNARFLSDYSQPNADYLSSVQQAEMLVTPENTVVPIVRVEDSENEKETTVSF